MQFLSALSLALSIFSFSHAFRHGNSTISRLHLHNASFVPDYVLTVTWEFASVACRYKPFALVNGSAPGPTIHMKEGQTTWVRVYNSMEGRNLTMHWHGLSQSVAPFSDGTPLASQWPIPEGHFFDYEIHPNIGEAGTYFYHSHVEFQAVSAAGALIVEEASGVPPYHYDEERLFLVSELFNYTDDAVVSLLTNPVTGWQGFSERMLVNGKGYPALDGNQSLAPAPWSSYQSNTTLTCGPEVFHVQPGKTYRFRSIGGSAYADVAYAFEDHDNLTVIEVDGGYTKPAYVDRIQIGPGQRFDYLLKTKSAQELQTLGKTDFWIQLQARGAAINTTSYAILRYETHGWNGQGKNVTDFPAMPPSTPPLTITQTFWNWLEYTLEPLVPNNFPSADKVSRTVYISSAQQLPGTEIFWSANNRSWTETDEHLGDTPYNILAPQAGYPYLVNIFEHGEAAIPDYNLSVSKYGGWDPNLNVYPAKVGEIIDIVLINNANGVANGYDSHPWHIHGGHVWDLGSGPGNYNATANEAKLKGYNPVMRDTTYLYKFSLTDLVGSTPYVPQGWRAWRLKVDVAGVWMVHCHILQHMIMGMQTVWVMGNSTQITAHSEPYVAGYLQYGGSAYGNASYDPLVYHYFD